MLSKGLEHLQADPADIAGLAPDHHNKASCHLCTGRESCLQLVKTSSAVKQSAIQQDIPVLRIPSKLAAAAFRKWTMVDILD